MEGAASSAAPGVRSVSSSRCSSSIASRADASIPDEQATARVGVGVEDDPRGARLHAHHRHVVGDDVVQLAGDAHPIQRHRLRRGDLALPLELGRALLERRSLDGGAPRALAEVVRPAEVERVDEDPQQHLGHERRERAGHDVGVLRVRDRVAVHHDDEPGEHAHDDRDPHDECASPVDRPRAHRVERDEHRDVADVHLGDAQRHRGEVGDRDDDRDRGRPPSAHGERARPARRRRRGRAAWSPAPRRRGLRSRSASR